jgi:hypothetical protein
MAVSFHIPSILSFMHHYPHWKCILIGKFRDIALTGPLPSPYESLPTFRVPSLSRKIHGFCLHWVMIVSLQILSNFSCTQSLQENSWILPSLGHDRLLTNPFQLFMYPASPGQFMDSAFIGSWSSPYKSLPTFHVPSLSRKINGFCLHWVMIISLQIPSNFSCTQPLQENSWILPSLGHDRLLTNPFQLFMYPSLHHRTEHSLDTA